ncbi:leucyl/phenylalanyl-tRNA--protein transferase [Pustulibacterium marinum]|uniref:Leucyl/phenylalanyl-tRNA--protein transferase n=1 Tax=Pustulibacterium marinum TaxID=1224947 RepID=A0A1I7EWW7_9FLAO|nr:leucyl/phenylalanyl-tRNA--protein transferase [Pustulibacterium marinum]SFU28423.1 leucyl/phenylalanyl-tRNA--protein transferase [Pustulibacterium marinum]
MIFLNDSLQFPHPENASPEGILAVGGDLSPERLLLAYSEGIFPWFDEDQPILWWSPDPRMVLFPEKLKVSKSMRQILRRNEFVVTFNQDFERVIRACASVKREGQYGTWITEDMIQAYLKLHHLGKAISVEVYKEDELVGGLYGIDLGTVFCGESMFSKVSNASKTGFITLVQMLKEKEYTLIDCQVYTDHLASLGAEEIPRIEFLKLLHQ